MSEQENTSLVTVTGASESGSQLVAVETGSGLMVQPLAEEPPKGEASTQEYRKGLGFLALLVVDFLVLTYFYQFLHGINVFELFRQPPALLPFDFIGGSANAFSIAVEIVYWALMGVVCQMAYQVSRAVVDGKFDAWKSTFNWISISLYAIGVAIALIFSLKVISLNVGDIRITLASAPIEVIIAISFILGFYSEESRRLLGRLRGRIVTGMETEGNGPENRGAARPQ